MASIKWVQPNGTSWFEFSNSHCLINQSNKSYYITSTQLNYTNSCAYYDDVNKRIYLFIVVDTQDSFWLTVNGSNYDQIYSTNNKIPSGSSVNGGYMAAKQGSDTIDGYHYSYVTSCRSYADISGDIPVYTTLSDAIAYLTTPYSQTYHLYTARIPARYSWQDDAWIKFEANNEPVITSDIGCTMTHTSPVINVTIKRTAGCWVYANGAYNLCFVCFFNQSTVITKYGSSDGITWTQTGTINANLQSNNYYYSIISYISINDQWLTNSALSCNSNWGNFKLITSDYPILESPTVQEWYDYLTMAIQPTWHSVQSITGNGLTIPLVTLKSDSINDGDPVSCASTSAFNVLPFSDNNVRSLINLVIGQNIIGNAVTITYTIPALKNDSYVSAKLYGKIGDNPACDETDDIIMDIDTSINEIYAEDLEYESEYFFCIQTISNDGVTLTSNVESIITSTETESVTFNYTGDIQTYTVPETGYYRIETWGAQGGNATNGILTARGGYGSYSVGEVLLYKDEVIYIDVGGQNGYNGGGGN